MQTPAHATNVFVPKKREEHNLKSYKHSSKRQTVKLTIWLKQPVYDEIQRIASHSQLSLSKIGATALEEWVHQRIYQQHETLLYPIIRQIIRDELRTFGNRMVFFLVRIAFAAEQSRILITNILDRLLRLHNAPEQTFTTLVDQSNKMAQRNIINKSPQIKSLIDEWEGSFPDRREEGSRLNG
jgi:predicted DNA-binding ribbon-helix-helix protein